MLYGEGERLGAVVDLAAGTATMCLPSRVITSATVFLRGGTGDDRFVLVGTDREPFEAERLRVWGDEGADTFVHGEQVDLVFVFEDGDSTASSRDVIEGWHQGDKLDLSALSGNLEVTMRHVGADTIIDAGPSFEVLLKGFAGELCQGDLLL